MFGWFLQLFSNGFLFFILHLSQPGSFAPPLSAAQEREALAKMHAGDKSARSELIEHNLRLVAHIVKKILRRIFGSGRSYFDRHGRADKGYRLVQARQGHAPCDICREMR